MLAGDLSKPRGRGGGSPALDSVARNEIPENRTGRSPPREGHGGGFPAMQECTFSSGHSRFMDILRIAESSVEKTGDVLRRPTGFLNWQRWDAGADIDALSGG